MNSLQVYIDGACQGNPGPSGIGIVIRQEGAPVRSIGRFIGTATNNIAEYTALIYALQECLAHKLCPVRIHTDSQLLYRQIMAEYKVRHPNIVGLHRQALELMALFSDVSIKHVPRESNKEADAVATRAIKQAQGIKGR